jgi:hypothetical protein
MMKLKAVSKRSKRSSKKHSIERRKVLLILLLIFFQIQIVPFNKLIQENWRRSSRKWESIETIFKNTRYLENKKDPLWHSWLNCIEFLPGSSFK